MPTATTFDPLKAARDLEAAGVDRRQAEAHAEALRAAAVADRDQLATKDDIRALKADIAASRTENRLALGFLGAMVLAMAARMFGLA